jgi:hypothetical protein
MVKPAIVNRIRTLAKEGHTCACMKHLKFSEKMSERIEITIVSG